MANRFALPAMNGLVTFEAAACTKSFTQAALELAVSQPAVSHAVRQLVDELGVVLIERRHKEIELTDAGCHLFEQASLGPTLIDQAVREVQTMKPTRTVSLSVSTATATWWLPPRIARFKLLHPKIELHRMTIDDDQDIERDHCAATSWP